VTTPTTTDTEPAPEPAAAPPASRHRVRRTFAWILLVLAAFLVGSASVAVWAARTVVNEDRFNVLVSNVVSDPGVISAASAYITDQAQMAVVNSGVIEQLPPALQSAANVVSGAIFSRVEQRVNDILSSDTGQELLLQAVKVAHRQAMKILQGKGIVNSDAFTIKDGTVTLNLIPVVRQVLIRLQQDGLVPSSINIPTDASQPGPLQQALGGRLPPDFGQLVIYRTNAASSDDLLNTAQRALAAGKRGVVLLVILALLCCVGAVLVAVKRRQAVFRVGVAIVIVCVLLIIVVRRVAAALPGATHTTGGEAVARAVGNAFKSSLTRALLLIALIAAITAVLAFFWRPLLAVAGRHQELATLAVIGVGLVLLLVLGISWASVIFAAIVVAGGLVAVRVLAKPPAPTEPASPAPT
jgi:lysylphosphatidylglycerol synthetase-like protein (DUF2156 family)